MQLFYALTLFVSAALLFLVQPMFAKMVLPRCLSWPGSATSLFPSESGRC